MKLKMCEKRMQRIRGDGGGAFAVPLMWKAEKKKESMKEERIWKKKCLSIYSNNWYIWYITTCIWWLVVINNIIQYILYVVVQTQTIPSDIPSGEPDGRLGKHKYPPPFFFGLIFIGRACVSVLPSAWEVNGGGLSSDFWHGHLLLKVHFSESVCKLIL